MNRLIQDHDVNAIYLAGPGHGGPALLANVYLEGTYTEIYPHITQDTEGTTTTPFDMVVLNGMSRYHLCIEAMRRATRVREITPPLIAECNDLLNKHHAYIRANFEDMPEVRDWMWTD